MAVNAPLELLSGSALTVVQNCQSLFPVHRDSELLWGTSIVRLPSLSPFVANDTTFFYMRCKYE